jgi:MFS family permease
MIDRGWDLAFFLFMGCRRRNFTLGVLNGIFYNLASAFIGSSSVLPAFVSQLTISKVLIGLSSNLEFAAWSLPQMLVAGLVGHKGRKLPLYIRMAALRSFSFGILVASIFLFGDQREFLLWLFFLLFTLYATAGGIAGVPFMEIVGKTIPLERRGSFFGMRIFFGGLLGVGGGWVVKMIMARLSYPSNFGLIFTLAFLSITIALILFCFVKEPWSQGEKRSFRDSLLKGPKIFKRDANYRRFFLVRMLLGSYLLGMPFYILYAQRVLGIQDELIGLCLSCERAGLFSSNVVWGKLSDKRSNRLILSFASISGLLSPFLVLFTSPSPLIFGLVFFCLGATRSGLHIGYINYLLEIAPPEERSTYVGFMNTIISPTIFFSALGGWIIDLTSFAFLFGLVGTLCLASFILSWGLGERK